MKEIVINVTNFYICMFLFWLHLINIVRFIFFLERIFPSKNIPELCFWMVLLFVKFIQVLEVVRWLIWNVWGLLNFNDVCHSTNRSSFVIIVRDSSYEDDYAYNSTKNSKY